VAILRDGRISYSGELDALKDQVKRLHVSSIHGLPDRFDLPGVLHQRVVGNDALLSVESYSPAMKQQIETELGASVEVQDLNLEDIFVELHA
jgi:ABC-2 type transport system ATP-binding protein